MKFDLTTIPDGVTVKDATLTVVGFWMDEVGGEELAATRVTGSWDVETVEASFPPFHPTPYPRVPEDIDTGTNEFIVTDLVRRVVEEGAPNQGFMLYFPNGVSYEDTNDFIAISCDNYNTWSRPSLTITYTVGTAPH